MNQIRTFALAVGLLVLVLGSATRADEKDEKALKELQGNYRIVGIEAKGLKVTEEDLKKKDSGGKMVIKGDQLIAHDEDGKEDPATIKLDVSQKPPHITITPKDGKSEVMHGIYKFENGVLTICLTEDPKNRPKEFKVEEKNIILTLKKQPAK